MSKTLREELKDEVDSLAYYVIRESCNLNVVEVMINEIKKIVNDLKTCEKEDIIKENE